MLLSSVAQAISRVKAQKKFVDFGIVGAVEGEEQSREAVLRLVTSYDPRIKTSLLELFEIPFEQVRPFICTHAPPAFVLFIDTPACTCLAWTMIRMPCVYDYLDVYSREYAFSIVQLIKVSYSLIHVSMIHVSTNSNVTVEHRRVDVSMAILNSTPRRSSWGAALPAGPSARYTVRRGGARPVTSRWTSL